MQLEPTTTTSPQHIVLKATASAYIVLGLIFGFMTVMAALTVSSDKSMAPALVASSGAWIVSYIWLARFRVVVDPDSLGYTTLFTGTRRYSFKDIRKISIESGVREYSDRFKPFVRLVVEPNKEIQARPLYINLKVFSRLAIRELLDALRTKYESLGRPEVVKKL